MPNLQVENRVQVGPLIREKTKNVFESNFIHAGRGISFWIESFEPIYLEMLRQALTTSVIKPFGVETKRWREIHLEELLTFIFDQTYSTLGRTLYELVEKGPFLETKTIFKSYSKLEQMALEIWVSVYHLQQAAGNEITKEEYIDQTFNLIAPNKQGE